VGLRTEIEDILPRRVASKMVRYGKQIETLDSFLLLPLEVLREGKVLKNHDFRKKQTKYPFANFQE
jgi:hypothetical protein